MSKLVHLLRHRDLLATLFLIAFPCVYFFKITLGQGVWFSMDMASFYYPVELELARALQAGRLPLWSTGVGAGFPLFAEGQMGAAYPINLLLIKFLPTDLAISYEILFHLAWMACGMYGLARSFKVGVLSAMLAGFVFSFNGFVLSQLCHAPIIYAASWLPWMVLFQRKFLLARAEENSRQAIWFLLTTCVWAMQFLLGFPQIAFMNGLAFGLFGWMTASHLNFRAGSFPILQRAFWIVLPVILGAAIGAVQLLPTYELIGYSIRGSSMGQGLAASFSLPPIFLTQFVNPFEQGRPTDETNGFFAYMSVAALGLAVLAPILKRNRWAIFLALFALIALTLTLGELNPAFQLLATLPLFNLFRVPPRYFHLALFGAILLSAMALHELGCRLENRKFSTRRFLTWGMIFVFGLGSIIALAQTQSIDFWLDLWRILPIILVLLFVIVVWLAWTRRISRLTWYGLINLLVVFDLACYAPPFLSTITPILDPSYAKLVPRSIAALDLPPYGERTFSDQSVYASFVAMRNSAMPNTGLIYGKESALFYSPLAFARHQAYVENPSPSMFNLLNVRYYTIALDPRPKGKPLTPPYALSLDVLDKETSFSPTLASTIELISFTEFGNDLADGTTIAELQVHARNGKTQTFPIRLGIETADWDYDLKEPSHARAPIAESFPAFFRPTGRSFEGHAYAAQFRFDMESEIDAITVRVIESDAGFAIQRLNLIDQPEQSISLAQLTHKNDFSLAYLSDTVAVWKNANPLPRAFIAHAAEIANDDQALARLHDVDFSPKDMVLLSDGRSMNDDGNVRAQDSVQIVRYESERVELAAETNRTGYLVLSDSWYPGWTASVDGQPMPIYRADVLFRAIAIEPGKHQVVFEYRPMSFVIGATISIISVLILIGISIVMASGASDALRPRNPQF